MSLLRRAERCLASQQTHAALNAFIQRRNNGAVLELLETASSRSSIGRPRSSIDGSFIALKDNICTLEEPTTCASAILEGFRSPFEATVVARLKAAGAIIAGKTNLDEFGMGSHSTTSIYGPVQSVHKDDGETLSAGGSSGGSAVAVATGQCDAALGTDTGGSVRLPAAYTGIVGFKPSYGMASRWGVIAYANSLDTVGILARTSSMARQVFGGTLSFATEVRWLTQIDIIQGFDARDPTSLSESTRSKINKKSLKRERPESHLNHRLTCLRIGIPIEYNTDGMQPQIREAWIRTLEKLRLHGHSIHAVTLPATKMALSAYYVLAPAEASSNLAKYDGVRYGNKGSDRDGRNSVLYSATRGAGFGDEVRRRILLGSYTLSAAAVDNYFIKAQKVRRLVQDDFDNIFALQHPLRDPKLYENASHGQIQGPGQLKRGNPAIDLILAPTAQSLPPRFGTLGGGLESYSADVLTVPASLAGLPAASVPVPCAGKPGFTGMQIMGQFGDDDMVLGFSEHVQGLNPTPTAPNGPQID